MPRKVGYSQYDEDDYDDDYDDYDDYYDNYDNREDTSKNTQKMNRNNEVSSQKIQPKETVKKPVWSCTICTFDNDESTIVCEICGVFRESFVKAGKDAKLNGNGVSCNSETSPVAKTQPNKTPVKASNIELLSENQSERTNTSYEKGNSVQSKGKNVKTPTLPEENEQIKKTSSASTSDSSQTLDSNLRQLNLNKDQPSASNSNPVSLEQYKPEKWMQVDQDNKTLNQLNLAIVGHVDSGKSTLSGRLLHLAGKISKREMHKNEKEAKEKGKGSFAVAWALDESKEERERGVTMTVGVAYFESKNYRIVILDSPGHKDFVPNLISGANQADAAVLVIDACKGSFEAGMEGQVPGVIGVGQTKEHAQLVKAFGVDQLIVAVNKMDSVNYSKQRYDEIKSQLGGFLKSCNFKDSSVTWVPLSAMENQNLVTPASDSRLTSWYKGMCLLDAIDSVQPPMRDVSKPLIMPICDVIKTQSMGQVAACGKLETGAIKIGSKVTVMPGWHSGTVRSIEQNSSPCSVARAGDSVAVVVQGVDQSELLPGGVLCHPDFPVPIAIRFELKICVLEIGTPILSGYEVEFHVHHAKTAARITKIVSLIDQKTGKISKSAPRFLKANQLAVIEVTLNGPVCVQEYAKCRALGRAFLRSTGNTVAVGIVTRIFDQD